VLLGLFGVYVDVQVDCFEGHHVDELIQHDAELVHAVQRLDKVFEQFWTGA